MFLTVLLLWFPVKCMFLTANFYIIIEKITHIHIIFWMNHSYNRFKKYIKFIFSCFQNMKTKII